MPGRPVPSDHTAERVAALYRAVQERIQHEINIATASGNLDRAAYLAERRAAIQSILQAAEAQAAAVTAVEIRNAYARAGQQATRTLNQLGLQTIKQSFDKTDTRRVEILIENATARFTDITTFVGRRTDDILRQISLEQMVANTGLTANDKAAALEAALNRAGVTTTAENGMRLINVGGRNFELGHYSQLVARTTPREAATQAMKAAITDNGYDLVTISSHSSSCDVCAEYDGNTYSLTGNTPGVPTLDEEPPFHPFCGHVLTPAAIY